MNIDGILKFVLKKSGANLSDMLPIFALSALACLPIFLYGIPNSADMAQHYQFAVTFYDSVSEGIWYPSLAHLTNTGFGDVGVRFYPPFSYYVLVAFRFLTGDWYYASCAAFFVWFLVSGVGVYLWAKEWFSRRAAVFAAIIYLFIPYHVNELYNSFLYAEFAASAILPFCFLFVTRICRRENSADVLGLAISYALLILTNLPLALIGSISLLVYALFSLDRKLYFKQTARLALSVFLGLAASSFYWLKMILEIGFVKHNSPVYSTTDRYDFHNHFAFSYYFIQAADPQVLKSLWFLDTLLIVSLGVFLPSIIVFFRSRNSDDAPRLSGVLAVFILALFLTTYLSQPIWENVPQLQKVQFPWRWMAIVSLCGVIFNAAVFERVLEYFRTEKRWLAVLVFGLIFPAFCFTTIKIMRPVDQNARAYFNPIVERLRKSGSYECWMPVWVKNERLGEVALSYKERPRETLSDRQTEKLIHFPAGEAVDAQLKAVYYPHWQATVNGEKTAVGKAANGTVLLRIPAEEALVKLEFIEPVYVRASRYVSLFCWLAIFGFAVTLILPAVRLKMSGRFPEKQ